MLCYVKCLQKSELFIEAKSILDALKTSSVTFPELNYEFQYRQYKQLKKTLQFQKAFDQLLQLEQFCKSFTSDIFICSKYLSPVYMQIALMYAESMVIQNAFENAEAAVLMCKVEKDVSINVLTKYEVGFAKIKRMLGFYSSAKDDLERILTLID